jgi:hypothetical protein
VYNSQLYKTSQTNNIGGNMELDGMTFEPVDTGVTYMKPTELPTKGKYFVGQFKEMINGQFGKNWKFAKKDGGNVVVNGCGALDSAMENVPPGTWCALTFVGKGKIKKGKFAGKTFNDVQVALCKAPVKETGSAVAEDEIPF